MITKRIIPCLDVRSGRVVKGTNFEGIKDVADPVEMARMYNAAGAGASTPSAVFSSDVSGAGAAKQQPAAAANSAAKPVEEESSDNRYYDELLAILNKRK